jgi:hypothetical protein
MARICLAVVVTVAGVLVVGAAQAKAPATGVDACGAGGACIHLGASDAEQFWTRAGEAGRPAGGAPFYVLRWHFDTEPEQSAYYVPARRAVRWLRSTSAWGVVSPDGVAALASLLRKLQPYPAPALTRVTIGGRVVSRPQGYLRLLSGKPSAIFPATTWLTVTLRSAAPSPWTNGASLIRLGRTAPYVVVDGWTFRIPSTVAKRARRGLPLDG